MPWRKRPACEPAIPIIWGQHSGYLYLQIREYQKGARKDDRMTPIAQTLTKEDAQALAEYFAGKPWPKTGAPDASKADTASAMTAIKSVVCTSCHLEEFLGDSSIPRLAGQEHDYLAKTMTDFRTHTRANNPGMSDLMNTVTPERPRRWPPTWPDFETPSIGLTRLFEREQRPITRAITTPLGERGWG